ncbi:MAG: DNA methylase, partial [Duncaniella sp.]|nr:DNA methylase [Duncaniella sp.]
SVNRLTDERKTVGKEPAVQLDLFTDYEEQRRRREAEEAVLSKERRRQEAVLKIKKKFGKNAILKGLNFADGATQRDRNCQIGGHHE